MPSWTNRNRRLSQIAKVSAISAAFMLGVGVATGHAQDTAGTKGDSALSRRTDTTQSATRNDSAAAPRTTTHAMKGHHRGHRRNVASQDSTKWGYPVDTSSKAQNPAGYRGMERPVNVLPPDSGAKSDTSAPADATSRINQRRRQDSASAPGQNPPGYRGMERPAALDSTRQQSADSSSRDTAQSQ
jgi:hypothetical protein